MPYLKEIKEYVPVNEQEASDKQVIINYIEKFRHNILTRENEIAHMTSSGLILNESMDKILMIHHNIYNTWTWTGGHADGEHIMLETAIKEAQEETGLENIRPLSEKMASLDILPVYGHVKRGNYVSSHLHLNTSYALIANEEDTLVVNEEETSGVGWIDVEKLHEYSNEPYLVNIYMKIVKWAREHKKK